MGNSGSSSNNSASHQQQCASGNQEIGRGWAHSFPREFARHHSQPPGHKVLPEPPNQRLRATNNGSIIHNGGTISGRRPSALTLPHDLSKGVYGSRSASASNLGPRSRSIEPSQRYRCCVCRANETRCREHEEAMEMKRFGSEPDLRYSPCDRYRNDRRNVDRRNCYAIGRRSGGGGGGYCPSERETRERESRYRARKKYKAPAPPGEITGNGGGNEEGSSPDSYKWESSGRERNRCRGIGSEDSRTVAAAARSANHQGPPPRRSRLFKTRAETKKSRESAANDYWQSACHPRREVDNEPGNQQGSHECGERGAAKRWRNGRWPRECESHRRRITESPESGNRPRLEGRPSERRSATTVTATSARRDGKNTLQRSLSSPEFQAELMQMARKVRSKLNCRRRLGPIGAATIITADPPVNGNSMDSRVDGNPRRIRGNAEKLRKSAIVGNGRAEENEDEEEKSSRIRDEREKVSLKKSSATKMALAAAIPGKTKTTTTTTTAARNKKISPPSSSFANRNKMADRGGSEIRAKHRGVVAREDEVESRHRIVERTQERDAATLNDSARSRDREVPEIVKNRGSAIDASAIARSDAPKDCRELSDPRGQGSGRESTPESARKARQRKIESRRVLDENHNEDEEDADEGEDAINGHETRMKNWNGLPPSGKATPKTYRFGADDESLRDIRRENGETQQVDRAKTRSQGRDLPEANDNPQNQNDNNKNSESGTDDIALKLRPTLPKKQLEIPRFSPSAAWRLLSALETPGPNASTASEEIPVMYEERAERPSRPPLGVVPGPPRSSHDKSGDSGISGDAGGGNDDSTLEIGTRSNERPVKTRGTMGQTTTTSVKARPAWTPQQDLGEESSSDAGVDSPPPIPPSSKFPSRPHVFSLSLPRDENRRTIADPTMMTSSTSTAAINAAAAASAASTLKISSARDAASSSFNSLQKLKRSVTGALGIGGGEIDERKRHASEGLGENWLLSSGGTSAPNSLRHANCANKKADNRENSSGADDRWPNDRGMSTRLEARRRNEEKIEDYRNGETDFPNVGRPPAFSYLASGGHVMYLPAVSAKNSDERHFFGHREAKMAGTRMRRSAEDARSPNDVGSFGVNGISINGGGGGAAIYHDLGIHRERSFTELHPRTKIYPNFFKSCENVSEMRQRGASPEDRQRSGQENCRDNADLVGNRVKNEDSNNNNNGSGKNCKGKRFTFQSTVRQIERRRLAEKLSREAEAKERQRKSELEVMRRVEEEFQRKRAREKANIRQQLRLYSMDENSSLPPAWDGSQLSRADPDGAPSSSSASSPTSAPPGKMSNRKSSIASDEYRHRKRLSETRAQQQQQQQQREYKDRRPKYYDWAPDSSSHLDVKQTTVHPKVVCDIPKSSNVFVDANLHTAKPANVVSTPRSDNYRKDFAHGAVAAKSSLASSDSELSQSNTRPHSRQNANKNKPLRSRSISPAKSDRAGSTNDESPVEAVKRERNLSVNGFILNGGVQPFVREKSYRPISFHPRLPPQPIPT